MEVCLQVCIKYPPILYSLVDSTVYREKEVKRYKTFVNQQRMS